MKEICKLAVEKGFDAKTFSTGWTLDFYLDKGRDILITETVTYLLLCEIQRWIRDELKIDISVNGNLVDEFYYEIFHIEYSGQYDYVMLLSSSYEEALKAGIKEVLK